MQQHWTCPRCSVANRLSAPTCVGCDWTARQAAIVAGAASSLVDAALAGLSTGRASAESRVAHSSSPPRNGRTVTPPRRTVTPPRRTGTPPHRTSNLPLTSDTHGLKSQSMPKLKAVAEAVPEPKTRREQQQAVELAAYTEPAAHPQPVAEAGPEQLLEPEPTPESRREQRPAVELAAEKETETEPEPVSEPAAHPQPVAEAGPEQPLKPEPKPESRREQRPAVELAAEKETETEPEPVSEPELEPGAEAVPTQLQDLAAKPVAYTEPEPEPEPVSEPEAHPQPVAEVAPRREQQSVVEPVAELEPQMTAQPKRVPDALSEPLFQPVPVSRSSRRGSGRFFDELDSWIDAAPAVLVRGDGYDDLHRRLTSAVVRSHGWSQWVVGRSDNGPGQLNPEQFVRFVRDVTGIIASKISDKSLVRVFKHIDEKANGAIDEGTLKRYLTKEELRSKSRLVTFGIDWEATVKSMRLDIYEFFVAVQMQQQRRSAVLQSSRHNTDALRSRDMVVRKLLTDDEIVALFRHIDSRGDGLVTAQMVVAFIQGDTSNQDVVETSTNDKAATDTCKLGLEAFSQAVHSLALSTGDQIANGEVEALFAAIDSSSAGCISAEDFTAFLGGGSLRSALEQLQAHQ